MLLLLLLACPEASPSGSSEVPQTCAPRPTEGWDRELAYEERTAEMGIEGVEGVRFAAADLDGDRYPDLYLWDGTSNARDDVAGGVLHHRLYLNREDGAGGRRFVDATVESGILTNREGEQGTSSNVHVFGDVDADGDLDLFAGRYFDRGTTDATGDCSEIYLNDGQAAFTLATSSDLCHPGGYPTSSAAFTDADADGTLDLWVVGWYLEYGASSESAQAELLRGNGDGTFEEITADAGLKQDRCGGSDNCVERADRFPAYGATACDINQDTWPDLLKTNYARSWNNLFVNKGHATFSDMGQESVFAADNNVDYSDNTRYACWCEAYGPCTPEPTIACDGAWPPEYWSAGYDDQPARNNGNSFTTVCGDVDNDGDADLYTAEIKHKWAGESSDGSQLLLNDGAGTFSRIPNGENGLEREHPRTRDWNEGDLYAAFLDFDSDGWKDILLGSSDYEDTQMWLWRQSSPGQFEDVSEATGMNQPWPAGLAVADFDLDGDLDVVTGSSNARAGTPWTDHRVHYYENVLPAPNFLRVEGFPVGVRVEVESGGLVQTQEVSGGYGVFGIQNDVALTFGLGDGCGVDQLTATWPGGASQSWEGISGNGAWRPDGAAD